MPTKIDPEVMLPQVENMIFKLAWKCAETYPVPFEEAKSEAYYAFMRACQDFNPDRGSQFSTWCYFWVWTHLKTFVTKRTVDPLVFVEINDDLLGAAPAVTSPSLELVEDMSSDAKEIITLLLETPGELLGEAMTPKRLLKSVMKFLERQGKSRSAVNRAHDEIRDRFQEAWAT